MNAFSQSSVSIIKHFQSQLAQTHKQADESTTRTLLNCYIREVAAPLGQLKEQPNAAIIQTLPLGWRHNHRSATWLLLNLTSSHHQLVIAVTRSTLLGNYRYVYPVLARSTKGSNAAWKQLNSQQLALLLVLNLCEAESMPYNHEFLQQIQLSLTNTTGILKHKLSKPTEEKTREDLYLYSEQSLTYGHPFHPTPKSRQWENTQDESEFAPEYQNEFQLHWFRVQSSLLRIETAAPLTPEQLMKDICPDNSSASNSTILVPVHPAQAKHVLKLASIQQAINNKLIEYIGPAYKTYAPTASVRTLYNPTSPWFLKGSLNIRITNCIRKNAIYELESALALHRRIQTIQPSLQAIHPGFRLLGEPGFFTLQLPNLNEQENKEVQEGFGMVVRQNITTILKKGEQAILAGALFQQGEPLKNLVKITDKLLWIEKYAQALIPPTLEAFFEYGLIFEPHLQNTVICIQDNLPTGVVLRDFEGVKLVDHLWPVETLQDLSHRAQKSVRYSFQQGWNRVRYCLLINNLAEAVTYLADDQTDLEKQLWKRIEQVIQAYLNHTENTSAVNSLTSLLAGEDIPSKANLLVRINKNPDRDAGYVPVKSPFNLRSK
jgi:siderophore synthetase component